MLDSGLCTLNPDLWTLWTCRLLTAKSRSVREASHQPAFIGNCLTISHTCLPCQPSRRDSPCVLCLLMIGLTVGLLTLFGGSEYGLSIVGVPAVLGNGCGIQELNYVALLQGSEMTARFHYSNRILCI